MHRHNQTITQPYYQYSQPYSSQQVRHYDDDRQRMMNQSNRHVMRMPRRQQDYYFQDSLNTQKYVNNDRQTMPINRYSKYNNIWSAFESGYINNAQNQLQQQQYIKNTQQQYIKNTTKNNRNQHINEHEYAHNYHPQSTQPYKVYTKHNNDDMKPTMYKINNHSNNQQPNISYRTHNYQCNELNINRINSSYHKHQYQQSYQDQRHYDSTNNNYSQYNQYHKPNSRLQFNQHHNQKEQSIHYQNKEQSIHYQNKEQSIHYQNSDVISSCNKYRQEIDYFDYQQQHQRVVHYDRQQQQYKQSNQQHQQKSMVQLLIQQIHYINTSISLYLQSNQHRHYHNIKHAHSQFNQLRQKVNLIQQLIEQNYKIYQASNIQQSSTNKIRQGLINNSKQYHLLYGLMMRQNNNKQQQNQCINYNKLNIIDYQQQFDTFYKLNSYYIGQKGIFINHNNHYINKLNNQSQRDNNKYSSQQCVNIFIRLIVEIKQFYRLNYLFKQNHHNNDQFNRQHKMHNQQHQDVNKVPLLIANMIWHIQLLRVTTSAYQHQLSQIIINSNHNNSNNSRQSLNEIKNSFVSLTNLSNLSVDIIHSLQQLLMIFLQQIMLQQQQHQQQQPSYNSTTRQRMQFFYYQYPIFNKQWICLLLDSILKYQMTIQSKLYSQSQPIFSYLIKNQLNKTITNNINNTNNKLKDSKKLVNPQHQQNHSSHTLVNKQKLLNNKNTSNKDNNKNKDKCNVSRQTVNNILSILLSILSFLLFPTTLNNNNSINPICQLLQQPIKKTILLKMRQYQSQLDKHQQQQHQLNNDEIRQLLIKKFILINQIANIVSFFTTKLTQSNNNKSRSKTEQINKLRQRSKKKRNNNKNNRKQQQQQKGHILYEQESNSNNNQLLPRNVNEQQQSDKLFIELKIMQMTLFVRQMADILIMDNIKPLQQLSNQNNNTQQQQQSILFTNTINQWMRRLSIQSVIKLLFEKVLKRKKLK